MYSVVPSSVVVVTLKLVVDVDSLAQAVRDTAKTTPAINNPIFFIIIFLQNVIFLITNIYTKEKNMWQKFFKLKKK